MTTSDYALIISLFSLLIAMGSFIWNVWSKFIFPKPKLIVSFMVMKTIPEVPGRERLLCLSVTNFGPGEVTISAAVARPIRPWYKRRVALGMLNPIDDLLKRDGPTGPFAGGIPKKLAVGENFSVYFPYQAKLFLNEPLDAVGVHDTFRRAHWAPRRDFLKAVEKYRADFPSA